MGGADEGVAQPGIAAFRRTLAELGWVADRNLQLDIRWADLASVAARAAELVQSRPDVLLAGPTFAVVALQKATSTIPIVFVLVSDPLARGIVTSLARPTGNVTGFSNPEFSLIGKWVQLLKEMDPRLVRMTIMTSAGNAVAANWQRTLNELAPRLAVEPAAATVRERDDVIGIIETVARQGSGGLIVPPDTLLESPFMRGAIRALTATYRVPAIFAQRSFFTDGGLMFYGVDQVDPFRSAAGYVDRILKGETPADLPVQQPVRFELAINISTAKALGLTVPPTLLAIADAVIE